MQKPGHVSGLVNTSNQLVNEYRYTPFGTPVNGYPVQGTPNPLQYMARELDVLSGLYYVRNRWYDPQQGRFVSEDPIGLAGGINQYAYAAHRPLDFLDPLGLQPVCVDWFIVTVDNTTGAVLAERYVTTTCYDVDGNDRRQGDNARCTIPPRLPPGASVNRNIGTAESQLSMIGYATLRLPGISTFQAGRWFKGMVEKGGLWDYQSNQGREFQNGGNFNYGAAGAAIGFSGGELLQLAGLQQWLNPGSRPEDGKPWLGPPYGDEPWDQTWIRQGTNYCANGCHKAPSPGAR